MYDQRQIYDNSQRSPHRTPVHGDGSLPKLPPLHTRASLEKDIQTINNKTPRKYLSESSTVGSFTPHSESQTVFNTPFSNNSRSPQWMSPSKTPTMRRRPPPPPNMFSDPDDVQRSQKAYPSTDVTVPNTDDSARYDLPFVKKPLTGGAYDKDARELHAASDNSTDIPSFEDIMPGTDSLDDPVYSQFISGLGRSDYSQRGVSSGYRKAQQYDQPTRDWSNDSDRFGIEGSEHSLKRLAMTIDTDVDLYNKPPVPRSSSRNVSGVSGVSRVSRASDNIDGYYSGSNYTFNNSGAHHSSFNSVSGALPLELIPSITTPTQPFNVDLLDENKLYQCYSIYRLSDIYEWVLKIYFEWFNEFVFGKIEFYQVVQRLLEFQAPSNFNQEKIDSNVDRIIDSLISQDAVRFETRTPSALQLKHSETVESMESEVIIITGGLDIQGIFTELLPCYSFADSNYDQTSPFRCYSFACSNNHSVDNKHHVKVSEMIKKPLGLWTDYWHLTSDDLKEIEPTEIQRQSFIFDLIVLEERSLNMANAAVDIYGMRFDPSLLPNEPEFFEMAFNVFKPLIEVHKTFILEPIFQKIDAKGKFIDGIGEIYLKWCNEAREPYLRYAECMATVHEIIRWEKQHKTAFSSWLDSVDHSPEITRSKMYYDVIFFGGYFKSLQNMVVTLNSILKVTNHAIADYTILKRVIKDVEKLSGEVDRVHGDAIDRRKLARFSSLLLQSSISKHNMPSYSSLTHNSHVSDQGSTASSDRLDIGLDRPERRLLLSGNVGRKRELWLDPTPVFLVLLDNYLLITEAITKGETLNYKLIGRPIPVDYLNLEKKIQPDDSQSILASANRDMKELSNNVPRTPITTTRPVLFSTKSNTSRQAQNYTRDIRPGISNIEPTESELSFKIRNTATNESSTFIAPNLTEKDLWIKGIMSVLEDNRRNEHGNVLEFNVVSAQFSYSEKDAPVNLPVAPEGSEIDSALKKYDFQNRGNSVLEQFPMVTSILCSDCFTFEGQKFLLVATTNGVLIRLESDEERKFVRVIQCSSVRQMEVNQKLGLLFVLDDRNLCYFNIPSIFGAYYNRKKYLTDNVIVGVVLRDKVGHFRFASDFGHSRHLFYERKGKIVILTPEFDSISKTFKFFKVYKEFKLPSTTLSKIETCDITVFKKSFIVCTSKGAILYHDIFNEEGVVLPTFAGEPSTNGHGNISLLSGNMFSPGGDTNNKDMSEQEKMLHFIKRDVTSNKTKPLTCFKLENSDSYLIVYDEAVIKVGRNGDITDAVSDILILDFYCTGASYFNDHLILVGDSLIQIYQLKNPSTTFGRLIPSQIIKGKKVQIVSSSPTDIFQVVVSHPDIASRQLLLTCDVSEH